MSRVVIERSVEKALRKLPQHIAANLHTWVRTVQEHGIRYAQTYPGHNDEALGGDRSGQRSFQLSRAYRGFYITSKGGTEVVVTVIEVNKHEY